MIDPHTPCPVPKFTAIRSGVAPPCPFGGCLECLSELTCKSGDLIRCVALTSKDLCCIDHIGLLLSDREENLVYRILDDLPVRFAEWNADGCG